MERRLVSKKTELLTEQEISRIVKNWCNKREEHELDREVVTGEVMEVEHKILK